MNVWSDYSHNTIQVRHTIVNNVIKCEVTSKSVRLIGEK